MGLESECTEGAKLRETGKCLPEADEAESSDDSMDGKGSRSESRPRRRESNGGGVRDLCSGEAV